MYDIDELDSGWHRRQRVCHFCTLAAFMSVYIIDFFLSFSIYEVFYFGLI